jgi:hypothetical protein
VPCIGRLVGDIAVELFGIDVGAPFAAFTRSASHHTVEAATADTEPVGAHGQGGGQVVQALVGAGRGTCGRAGGAAGGAGKHPLPGIDVDLGQADVGLHAPGGQGHAFADVQAQADAPPQHARLGAIDRPVVGQRQQRLLGRTDVQRQPVGFGHLADDDAGTVFVAQRQRLIGRLAQRGRQVDRQAAQVAAQAQLGHAATELQLAAVDGAAAGRLEQARDQAQVAVAQALGGGRALTGETQPRACRVLGGRAQPAFEPQFASIDRGPRFADLETGLAELQQPAGLAQLGRRRLDQHIVAGGSGPVR